jgi:hypothetical protein
MHQTRFTAHGAGRQTAPIASRAVYGQPVPAAGAGIERTRPVRLWPDIKAPGFE